MAKPYQHSGYSTDSNREYILGYQAGYADAEAKLKEEIAKTFGHTKGEHQPCTCELCQEQELP